MKKMKVRTLVEIAIFAAIGTILDMLQTAITGGFWPWGGSIGFAMIPVFIMMFRHGWWAGFLTGLIMGILDLLDGFYAVSDAWYKVFIQMGLDYFFAYAAISIGCVMRPLFMKTKKVIFLITGCLIGGFGKFLCHYFSGVIFWGSYFDKTKYLNKWTYSLCYNGPFVLVCTILSIIILIPVFLKVPGILDPNYEKKDE